jgi:hypothetical protein
MHRTHRSAASALFVVVGLSFGVSLGHAQTTAGTSTVIVVPVAAQTASFVSEVTLFNPNGAPITVNLAYYDANNLASAGAKPCTAVVVPANRSVQFGLSGQCALGSGSHFGLLVLAEQTQTLEFHGHVRTQSPQGVGFSTEGFPLAHFNAGTQHVTGLRKAAAGSGLPAFQSNCFVASLGQAVSYELRLFDGSTNAQIGSTLSGTLGAYQQLRYLDVFSALPNGVGAAGANYGNVRAQFSNVTGNGVPLIGFCTVQENQTFAADFRIAKSYAASVNLPADVYVQNGNAFGTTAILGTTDSHPLEIRVNGSRVMRYEPNATSPNVVGGSPNNSVNAAAHGQTVAGGGEPGNSCGGSCGNHATNYFATVSGGRINQATGMVSVVAGGNTNTASNYGTSVGGGDNNAASGFESTVGGGYSNSASGDGAAIAGGTLNEAIGVVSTIAGGTANQATGDKSVVGGGDSNQAANVGSSVLGGLQNLADGSYATVPGGRSNQASGDYSLAAGYRAKANGTGTFVWADSNNFDHVVTTNNAFSVRATGGANFVLGLNAGGGSSWGCSIVFGSNNWACSSDRNAKENLEVVDGQRVLRRLAEMAFLTWSAKGGDPSVRHLGPTAQDFRAAFGLGDDDKTIGSGDATGVALAAIQGLYQVVREKDAALTAQAERMAVQAERIEAQTARIAEQARRMVVLEASVEAQRRMTEALLRSVDELLVRTGGDARVARAD